MNPVSRRLRAACLALAFTPAAAVVNAQAITATTQAPAPGRMEVGALVYDGIAPADPAPLSAYLAVHGTGFAGWLADGSLLVTTRPGSAGPLQRVGEPLGRREALAFDAGPVQAGIAHPYDANQLAVLAAGEGNAAPQLYLQQRTTGDTRRLTDGHSRHGAAVWASDGRRLAFPGYGRDGTSCDIYTVDTSQADPAPRLVVGGDSSALEVEDWSPDDTRLLLLRRRSATDSQLLVVDVATGDLQVIVPRPVTGAGGGEPARVSAGQGRFTRDGRGVLALTDGGGEFHQLVRVDLATGETQVLAPQDSHDVERFALSRDGRYLAYTLDEAGYSRLVVHDLLQKADLLLPALPPGAVVSALGFDASGRRLALTVQSAQRPPDVHVLDIGGERPVLTAWTHSTTGALASDTPAGAEPITFPTWDQVGSQQRMISAFFYAPQGTGPHPVLIDLGDGPPSRSRPAWNPFTQYLVQELGYAVVAPNLRGASGYGRSFLELGDGPLREDAVRDVGSLLVWIGLQPGLDRSKVVVMGNARGGHMALSSLANYGDRLAGAIVTGPGSAAAANARAIRQPLLMGLDEPAGPLEQLARQVRLNGVAAGYLGARAGAATAPESRDAFLAQAAAFLAGLR